MAFSMGEGSFGLFHSVRFENRSFPPFVKKRVPLTLPHIAVPIDPGVLGGVGFDMVGVQRRETQNHKAGEGGQHRSHQNTDLGFLDQ